MSVRSMIIQAWFSCPGLLFSPHLPCPQATATSVISTPSAASAVQDFLPSWDLRFHMNIFHICFPLTKIVRVLFSNIIGSFGFYLA